MGDLGLPGLGKWSWQTRLGKGLTHTFPLNSPKYRKPLANRDCFSNLTPGLTVAYIVDVQLCSDTSRHIKFYVYLKLPIFFHKSFADIYNRLLIGGAPPAESSSSFSLTLSSQFLPLWPYTFFFCLYGLKHVLKLITLQTQSQLPLC